MHVYIETIIKKNKSGYGLIIKPNGFKEGIKYIGLGSRIKDHNKLFQLAITKFIKPTRKKEDLKIFYNPRLIDLDQIEKINNKVEYDFLSNDEENKKIVEELALLSQKYPVCETVLLHKVQKENNYIYNIDLPTYYVKHITYDLELKRKDILTNFKNLFERKIETYISIFTVIPEEKYYKEWYWTVISNNYDLIDPVIPYFVKDDNEHINILRNLFGLNEDDATDFSNYLSSKLKELIHDFHIYYNSHKQKSKVFQLIAEGGFTTLECRGEKYHINAKIYNLAKKFYKECNLKFNAQELFQLLWCLVTRHKYLKIWNNSYQISNLPSSLIRLRDRSNFDFELFGSVFNHTYTNYCSLFYDIESYFGSKGSYFRITPVEGNYYANPPFNFNIMNKMTDNILNSLKNETYNSNLNFYVVLPTWDEHGRKLLLEYCNKYRKFKDKYNENDFNAILRLRNNNYLVKHIILCQDKVKYYNFFQGKDTTDISATSIFLLGKRMKKQMKENLIKNTKNIYLLCDHDFEDFDENTIICG